MPRFAKHDFTKYQPQPSSTDAGYSTDRPSWPSSNILNQYVANVFCSGVAMNIFSMASPKLERKQECKERKNGYKLWSAKAMDRRWMKYRRFFDLQQNRPFQIFQIHRIPSDLHQLDQSQVQSQNCDHRTFNVFKIFNIRGNPRFSQAACRRHASPMRITVHFRRAYRRLGEIKSRWGLRLVSGLKGNIYRKPVFFFGCWYVNQISKGFQSIFPSSNSVTLTTVMLRRDHNGGKVFLTFCPKMFPTTALLALRRFHLKHPPGWNNKINLIKFQSETIKKISCHWLTLLHA